MPHQILDEYTKHHGSPAYTVEHYDLDLTVKLASNLLDGKAVLRVRALQQISEVALNLSGLKVVKALVQGRKAAVSKKHHRTVIALPRQLAAGEHAEVSLRYTGSPQAPEGQWGEVGWEELTDGILVSGQPVGASTWFPCNDHPSHKSSYRFSITTDAGYRAVANGKLVSHRRAASRDTWIYEQHEPMATYLATLQIGRYSEIPFDKDRHILAYSVPGRDNQVRGAFSRQGDMVEVFERHYGPYPFEDYKVVVVDDELEIPLEAQGMSIFGTNHLSLDWEAQRLIAHEFAHQWFGNSLTPLRWKDIWLNEGFACFSEWLYSDGAKVLSLEQRAKDAWELLHSQEQDLLISDPGPKDMFDDRVYKRGALTLYALMKHLGRDRFFEIVRDWVSRYRFASVSTQLFMEHVAELAPQANTHELFDSWLFSSKLPDFPR